MHSISSILRSWRDPRGRFVFLILLWLLISAMSGVMTTVDGKRSLYPGVFLFGGAIVVGVVGWKAIPHRRVLFANFAGIAAAFLIAELFCTFVFKAGPRTRAKVIDGPSQTMKVVEKQEQGVSWKVREDDGALLYFSPDGLGSEGPNHLRMASNARLRSKRVAKGVPLYDVVYTINEHGFRVTPAALPGLPTVAFLGCSFTFGMGLEDDQTVPNQFIVRSKGRFSALNFGVPGHAPNCALAFLEENEERPSTQGMNIVAGVYVTMADHPRRLMGGRPWTLGLPRYVIRDGVLVRDGVIEDTSGYGGLPGGFLERAFNQLGKIAMADILLKHWAGRHYEIYVAVLKRMAEVFEQRYHAPFVVVTWLWDTPQERAQYEMLQRAGLHLVDLGDLLRAGNGAVTIPKDGHPNAFANGVIADKLLTHFEAMGIGTPSR